MAIEERQISQIEERPYKPTAAEILQAKAQDEGDVIQPEKRHPQLQEEFSNPTQYPGFEDLSKKEQLERIAFSQFDPANQTATGTFVPPGTYEHPLSRMIASVLPTLAVPETKLGGSLISPFLNALSRIGSGTASSIAYQSPNIKNMEDLKNVTSESAKFNSLLEGIFAPFRLASGISELYNPVKYTSNKASTIRNEYNAAKSLQQETYKPVFKKYGDEKISENPLSDLSYTKKQTRYFTPDVRKKYDDLLESPTLQNLHDFQSQVGKDYSRVATNPNKINTAQTLRNVREDAKKKIQNYLSKDKNALSQYNLGSEITKNQVSPYEANATLRGVINGVKDDVSPKQLANAIKRGTEKILYKEGDKAITAIPEGHVLRNHLNDINFRINAGNAAKNLIPKIARDFSPNLPAFIQNPLIQSLMNASKPIYYGSGRSVINALMNNSREQR